MNENLETFGLIVFCVVGIGLVFCAFWLISYMRAYMSKSFKKNVIVKRGGRTIGYYTPDSFDRMTKEMKEAPAAVSNKLKELTGRAMDVVKKKKVETVIADTTTDKITKLNSLQELKNNGTITPEEFQILKDEIMNS